MLLLHDYFLFEILNILNFESGFLNHGNSRLIETSTVHQISLQNLKTWHVIALNLVIFAILHSQNIICTTIRLVASLNRTLFLQIAKF